MQMIPWIHYASSLCREPGIGISHHSPHAPSLGVPIFHLLISFSFVLFTSMVQGFITPHLDSLNCLLKRTMFPWLHGLILLSIPHTSSTRSYFLSNARSRSVFLGSLVGSLSVRFLQNLAPFSLLRFLSQYFFHTGIHILEDGVFVYSFHQYKCTI